MRPFIKPNSLARIATPPKAAATPNLAESAIAPRRRLLQRSRRKPPSLQGTKIGKPAATNPGSSGSKISVNQDLIKLTKSAMILFQRLDGWAALETFSNKLLKLSPSFNCKDYGTRKLSNLVANIDVFTTKNNPKSQKNLKSLIGISSSNDGRWVGGDSLPPSRRMTLRATISTQGYGPLKVSWKSVKSAEVHIVLGTRPLQNAKADEKSGGQSPSPESATTGLRVRRGSRCLGTER